MSYLGPVVDEEKGHFGKLSTRITLDPVVPEGLVFDTYCPSLKKDLKDKTCDQCGAYFASKKIKLSHKKWHTI